MNKPLFHPAVELPITAIIKDLPQSLLISGQKGIGLFTVAQFIAGTNVSHVVQPTTATATPIISVETIRELYRHARTKMATRRIIIIDDADAMSLSAQNAFLKLLEEPNNSTHFILTSHAPEQLLPTIRSRVQPLHLPVLSSSQSINLITRRGISDPKKQTQLLFLANGLPAELSRLIEDTKYFTARARLINDAREFITATSYQKLCIIQRYKGDRDGTLRLLDSIIAVLHFTLQTKPQSMLISQITTLLEARERISANQNILLQLSRAVI
jgi:DNA polymerase-3 subunit delta'